METAPSLPGGSDFNRGAPARARLGVVAALLLVLLPAALAAGATPDLVIEVVPPAVAVPAQGEVEALVVLRNPGPERLKGLRLSWLSHAGVSIAAGAKPLPDLGPHGADALRVHLARTANGPLKGNVYLKVDYAWAQGDGRAVPRIAVGSFGVLPQEPEAPAPLAAVEVKTGMKALVEYRPELLYLSIMNTSSWPIDILGITTEGPEFVSIEALRPPQRLGLPPRDTQILPYRLRAAGSARSPIRSGRHLLLFHVSLRSQAEGRPVGASVLASREIDVGVLGESEILTALGVPSFLVLPGFLMITTFALLWHLFPASGAPADDKPLISAKSPDFWLIAITLSILSAVLYPCITGWRGARRNYLEGYGLADVIWVWTVSILIATLVFFGRVLVLRCLAAWRRRSTPAAFDSPLALLRKLHRQGLSLKRPQVDPGVGEAGAQAFLLQPLDGRPRVWVGPAIRITGLTALDGQGRKRLSELIDRADARELARMLKTESGKGLRLDWKPGGLKRPLEVAVETIKEKASKSIVELEGGNFDE